ncbi:MAG: HlyD family type I secretion periplasmic adaptor subunit [Pseudomonadota bacterium]
MKPSEAGATVIRLPFAGPQRRSRDELEFLPAALEIIETPASPAGRAIAATIVGFIAVAILWATFSKIDIIATSQGRVIPSGRSKIIQPFETGVVRAILVSDGQTVQKGDVLLRLDPTEDEADETRLSYDLAQDKLDIARLSALLADKIVSFDGSGTDADQTAILVAKSQMQAQAADEAAKIASIDRQIAGKEAEARETQATIAKLTATLPLLVKQRDIRKALLARQLDLESTYLQIEQQVVENQHGADEQQQHLLSINETIASLKKQRAETDANYREQLLADLAKAETQAAEHAQEIAKAKQRRDLRVLRSPVDGTVQQLAVHTIGGIVTPAEQLMVIVPKESKLEIEATLANRDVGFVHKGQKVEVKIEAYTFTRYGLLHGKVTSISHDAVAPQNANYANDQGSSNGANNDPSKDDPDNQSRMPSYVVHVALKESGIETEQGYMPLEPGMAVTAEIKTGQRSIISYLLSPLVRYKQEGLRER